MEEFYNAKTVELAYDEHNPPVESREPPILLLHGLFMNRKIFRNVAKLLSKETARKVYVVDLRGHGSSPHSKVMNIFAMAADVKRFIQEKNLKKLTFVCNSMGTRIGSILAHDQPEMVDKLVFIEISPYCTDSRRSEPALQFFDVADRYLKRLGRCATIDTLTEVAGSLTFLQGPASESYKKLVRTNLAEGENGIKPVMDLQGIREAYTSRKLELSPLGVFSGDTLFLYGSSSPSYLRDDKDPSLKKYFPKVKIVGVDGASHMVAIEKPEKFVGIVSNFLNE